MALNGGDEAEGRDGGEERGGADGRGGAVGRGGGRPQRGESSGEGNDILSEILEELKKIRKLLEKKYTEEVIKRTIHSVVPQPPSVPVHPSEDLSSRIEYTSLAMQWFTCIQGFFSFTVQLLNATAIAQMNVLIAFWVISSVLLVVLTFLGI